MLKLPPGLQLTIRRVTRKTVDEVLIERIAEEAPPETEGAAPAAR